MKLRSFLLSALCLPLVACSVSNTFDDPAGYVRPQVAPNPMHVPVVLTGQVYEEAYSGMAIGSTHEIDAVITTNTSERFEYAGGDLSKFARSVCENFAQREKEPLLDKRMSGTVSINSFTPGINKFTGEISYYIGKALGSDGTGGNISCNVKYELEVNSADNTLSNGFVSVAMDIFTSIPLGRDDMTGDLTGGDSTSRNARVVRFKIIGARPAQ
jgi:hypothetical protein